MTAPFAAILETVASEMVSAQRRYSDLHSTHEAWGVLAEEWDELREAIHANDRERITREAIQVAAVAARLADQLRRGDAAFVERSGLATAPASSS
jgi:NTP pyrophosphatase (non-canonical NTP hydrolase)